MSQEQLPPADSPALADLTRAPGEDRAALGLEERRGTYVITATGEGAIPPRLTVVDGEGDPVAVYIIEGLATPPSSRLYVADLDSGTPARQTHDGP